MMKRTFVKKVNFNKLNRRSNKKFASRVNIILLVLFLGASALAVYFYIQFNEIRKNPQKIVEEQARQLVSEVSKLIVLPEDEEPSIATVSDPEQLAGQPFFSKAKKGDKVLIYTNAQKAILYDPVAKKIIDIAPLNIGSNVGNASGTVSNSP